VTKFIAHSDWTLTLDDMRKKSRMPSSCWIGMRLTLEVAVRRIDINPAVKCTAEVSEMLEEVGIAGQHYVNTVLQGDPSVCLGDLRPVQRNTGG
jgi:hypothetical protein